MLTVPDGAYGELYERIDGESRWAGLAAIDGAMLRETAPMLRDWDLQSTLLRRALQGGARHLAAEGPVAILDGGDDLAELERRIIASALESRGGWAIAPAGAGRARLHPAADGEPRSARAWSARPRALLTGLGAGAARLRDWLWTGLALLLLATPLEGIALTGWRGCACRATRGAAGGACSMPAFAGAGLVASPTRWPPRSAGAWSCSPSTTLAFLVALEHRDRGPARSRARCCSPSARA